MCNFKNNSTLFLMSKDVNLTFSENLARLRKMKGLSQGDLAKLSGLTRRIIGHYENEAVEPPLRNIRAIADALGVRISELLDETRNLAKQSNDLTDIDPRSVKKLKDILSLPPEDRNDLYRILNKMLKKNQLETQKKSTG
jgi:transcriptional regulator with XRE-family HTH domain